MSKLVPFFAADGDLKEVAAAIEARQRLQYVVAGLFDTPELSIAGSVKAIESFGIAQTGDQAQERSYLVVPANRQINVREVPQRRGGVKYAIDQVQNPATVVMRPGGRFGDVAVIAGQIGTAADDVSALELFKLFEREIKRRFSRVKSHYVGPSAKALMESGARLTMSVRSPAEYDLK
jgi:hypothetical protein